MEIIREDYWLERLKDRDGVTLAQFLASLPADEREWAKETILAHAKDVPACYCVDGRQRPSFPEKWVSVFFGWPSGVYHMAKCWRRWNEAPKFMRDECHEAHNKANDLSYSAARAHDWRQEKEFLRASKFWRHRGYDLSNEIYWTHYQDPACLI